MEIFEEKVVIGQFAVSKGICTISVIQKVYLLGYQLDVQLVPFFYSDSHSVIEV